MELTIETLENLQSYFDTEEKARNFMEECRWNGKPVCPSCGFDKIIYTLRDGKTKRCGNKTCRVDFTVTTKSLLSNTKLSIREWMGYIFLYAKTKGRFSVSNDKSINFITAFFVDVKLKEIFKSLPTALSTGHLFLQACKNIFNIVHQWEAFRKKELWNNKLIKSGELIDLGDPNTYNRIVIHCRKQLYYAINKRFIFHMFCTPEELIAECYISMSDSEISKVTGDFLIVALRKQQNKMWVKHIKDTPKLDAWVKNYNKEWKKMGRLNLGNWYVLSLINDKLKNSYFGYNYSKDEILKMIQLKRQSLSALRLKNGNIMNVAFENTYGLR